MAASPQNNCLEPREDANDQDSVAEPIDWTEAAEALCEAIDARAKKLAQALADEVFESFLYNVQDYLRENLAFNLGGELKRAKQGELEANSALREVAETLGVRAAAWPHSPTVGQVRVDALAKIAALLGNDPRGEQVGRAPPSPPDAATAPGGVQPSNPEPQS